MGLGKIKFQGIAGLLGANVGFAYEQQNINSGAISAAEGDETTTDSTGNVVSVTLGIDLAENYIGINIDKALINTVFGMLGETLEKAGIASLPDVQDLELVLAFGESTVESIELSTTLDAAGTGAIISISDIQLALENSLDVEDLVGRVKTQFAGITYSKTAGVMTLLQNLLDSLDANLALTVDKRGRSVVQSTSSWGNGLGAIGADFEAAETNFRSTIRALSTSGRYNIAADGNLSGNGGAFTSFMLKLDVSAKHPHIGTTLRGADTIDLDVYFGNNNLWINDIGIDLGTAGDIIGIFASTLLNWINIGNFINPDTGKLFDFAYSDADSGTWADTNPVATTASDGAANVAADDWTYGRDDDDLTHSGSWVGNDASANTNDDAHYKLDTANQASEYSYPLNLTGLVDKVEVNLFNSTGYQPYLEYMTNTSISAENAASLISVKVELNKYAYNELLVFLYTTILSLVHYNVDVNTTGVYYFAYQSGNMWDESPENRVLMRHVGSNRKYVISNLFKELDSIAYMDDLTEQEKTERRVQLLDPYVRSLPLGLLEWLLYDMLRSVGDGIVSNNAPGVGALAGSALGDITILIASLLPPFASMDANAVNPSLNLYIDLAPESSFYGQGTKEIAPGIQAIELMVNAEKNGDGRQLVQYYTGSDGQRVAREGEIYYTIDESATAQNMVDAWVLAINPSNLVVDSNNTTYEGKGVLNLLEAGSLAAQPTLPIDKIVVDDVGTKSATAYNGNDVVGTGTLNGDWLVNGLGLPQTAKVNLVSPTSQKDVVLIWDAGALDFSPSALEENNRLAGYVYGYALNLVVAMIPVYVTDSQYFEGVYEVNNGGKGAAVSLDWTGGDTAIADDLVYIEFRNGNGYVFGKQAVDELTGDPLYAVLRNGNTVYMLKTTTTTDAEGNVTVTSEFGFYDINIQDTETDAYTVAVYPAYTAYTDGTNVVVRDATYRVLRNGGADITDPKALPVGTFSWDLNGLDYGWDGMNGDKTVTVGISYQWGFSATQTHDVTLSISSALIDSVESGYDYTDPNFETAYGSWSDFAAVLGLTDKTLAEARTAIVEYFKDLGIKGGNFVTADGGRGGEIGSRTVVGWDLTELLNAVSRRPGRNVTVDITMYVGGFNVWKELQETDLGVGGAWEYVRGFADDFLINVDGAWVMNPSADQVQKVYNNVGGNMGFVAAAQPVTVTISIGEEGGFEWTTPAASGGDDVTTPDTYSFSDGSATALNGGVQTYEITTAAQLYGAMPESGSVVHPDGTTKRAAFDWNGFAYDTDSALNVARLSVTSGGDRIDTDVVVTLADNADVQDAAGNINATPETEATPVTVVKPKFRAMSIDPLVYGTLGAFIAANRDGGELEVKLADGTEITVTVVSWSDKLASDAALPLAGARYTDNIATFKGEDGKTLYQAVVPVIVNARVIEDAEVLLGDGFKLVSQTRRFAETVRRYVADGQVIEVSYSRDTHLPTGITVMNPYAYQESTVFGTETKMEITFADGYVETYPFTLTGVTDPKYGDESATSTAKWSAGTLNGTLEFMFSALRITGANMLSDIAYGDLNDKHQDFAPYKDMYMGEKLLPTPFGVDNGKEQLDKGVTVYIDGMLVPVSALDNYTGKAEGMDAPRYTELKGEGTDAKVYRYNADGTYNAKGEYAYVYAAKHTFKQSELTWDNSGISYNYNGGVRRTTVKIKADNSGLEGEMTMPINIVSGRIERLSFVNAGDDSAPDYSAYFEGNTEGESNTKGAEYFAKHWKLVGEGEDAVYKLVFDPFEVDVSTGSAYDIDEAVMKPDPENADVKILDYYVYFPMKADVVTASGAVIKEAKITWSNLGAIRNSYVGGEFSARITLAAQLTGEQDKDGNDIQAFGTQGSTIPFVSVENRSFADGATLNGIDALPTDGKVVTEGEQTSYIDPLDFDLAEFSAQVENITSVNININGREDPVTFVKNGTDGYTLTWVYTGMNVSYLGGKVSLIARLTGPDGYAQDYPIDYLVSRVVASKIVERNKSTGAVGGESFTFGTDVANAGFGRANETYTVQPYEPSTFEMPTSWQITYKRFNPNADGSFGTDSTGTDVTENVTYLRASMPAGAKVTYDNAKNGVANAGDAMITLGSGQRVRIPVAVAKQPTGGTIPGEESITVGNATTGIRSTYKLPSKTKTTEGTEVVGIVWYGRVFIGSANYIVSFSVADAGSDGKITLPFVNGRTVTYVLTAYVGAVVDANGKVLDWSNTGKLPTSSSQTYETFGEDVAKTGRQVPNGDHQKTLSLAVNG